MSTGGSDDENFYETAMLRDVRGSRCCCWGFGHAQAATVAFGTVLDNTGAVVPNAK